MGDEEACRQRGMEDMTEVFRAAQSSEINDQIGVCSSAYQCRKKRCHGCTLAITTHYRISLVHERLKAYLNPNTPWVRV